MSERIRALKPYEVECRIGTTSAKGFSLLLYKDARCDKKILDEVFGLYGWKNDYKEIKGNLFCTISIWDKENKQWINKTDCGIESRRDESGNQKKGEASDAFKRAGFNIGIGRELYSAPFIWVSAETEQKTKGKYVPVNKYDKYIVSKMEVDDEKITDLEITRIRNFKEEVVFTFRNGKTQYTEKEVSKKANNINNKKPAKSKKISKNNFTLIQEFKKLCEAKGKNFIEEAGAIGIENINEATESELKELIADIRG